MNLNSMPTKEELKAILASVDDNAGHHILWVDTRGFVHLSQLPSGQTPVGFSRSRDDICIRYETFGVGNGYTGPEGASDDSLVHRLYTSMTESWERARDSNKENYIDWF